jgi:hypothetical protein
MLRALVLFLFAAVANAATVTLAWDPVVDSRLRGYEVFIGSASRSYELPTRTTNTTHTFNNLTSGRTHYFAVRSWGIGSPEPVEIFSDYASLQGSIGPGEIAVNLPPATTTVPMIWGTLSMFVTSGAKVVTVTNNGSHPITFQTFRATGNTSDFGPKNRTCNIGTVLQVGQSCTLSYVFRPLAPGPRSIVVTVTSDSDIWVLQMSGTGRGFRLDPETLDWGVVPLGQYPEKTFVFRALTPLTINNIIRGGSAFIPTNSTCAVGMTMVKDQTCSVTVKMVGGTVGFKGGSMKFETTAGVGTVGYRATVQ